MDKHFEELLLQYVEESDKTKRQQIEKNLWKKFGANKAFTEENAHTQEEFDIRVGIGIDHGDALLIGGPDYFGAAVNRASKLGEDIAGPGEILMTETAFELLPKDAGIPHEPLELEISGIKLNAISIKY